MHQRRSFCNLIQRRRKKYLIANHSNTSFHIKGVQAYSNFLKPQAYVSAHMYEIRCKQCYIVFLNEFIIWNEILECSILQQFQWII